MQQHQPPGGCGSVSVVGVVGGGAAGVFTVVQLARSWAGPEPLHVVLYDASPRLGRGLAYSTADPAHLLNVPVGRMSAIDEDAEHFLRWVRRREPMARPEDFRPRCDYGDYLAETLADHAGAVALAVRRRAVRDVVRSGGRFRLVYDDGSDVVDAVVLALGHAPPAALPVTAARESPGYVADPWVAGALRDAGDIAREGDTVLTVGTGLTAIDVALSLASRGRRVVAVSRRGLLPRAHLQPRPAPHPFRVPVGPAPLTAGQLEQLVATLVADARDQGLDWRAAVDGLRPVTSTLWQRLSVEERRRFLDGPARRWEVLRHRMAPQVAHTVERLIRDGRLVVMTGQVTSVVGDGTRWQVSVGRDRIVERLSVNAVVNCTGTGCDITQYPHGLGARLVGAGLVTRDPLALGILTTDDGAVVAADGRADGGMWALGSLRRGSLYESTAVPEIRAQAATIARHLTGALAATPYPTPGVTTLSSPIMR
jgi:uncharacterized NAD(P)/FAD-binding protein YdhS